MFHRRGFTPLLLLAVVSCAQATLTSPTGSGDEPPPPPGTVTDGGGGETSEGGRPDGGAPSGKTTPIRVLAANISSGAASTYDPPESIRILQGLHPDVALLQELGYGDGSAGDLRAFVDEAFGKDFVVFREDGAQIPNGIVSRYPLLTSGRWQDPEVDNRGFVYAKLDVPGPRDLWAVSVHLLTTGATDRRSEAKALVDELTKVLGPDDLLVIGGDLNTDARSESCLDELAAVVETEGPYPVDHAKNGSTNAPRNKPYDWLLASSLLTNRQTATTIGKSTFGSGLVFDSRVYEPLTEVAPIQVGDSAALNMQHMPVVRDFLLEE